MNSSKSQTWKINDYISQGKQLKDDQDFVLTQMIEVSKKLNLIFERYEKLQDNIKDLDYKEIQALNKSIIKNKTYIKPMVLMFKTMEELKNDKTKKVDTK